MGVVATDPLARSVLRRYGELRTKRLAWEPDWRDLRDLVRPMTGEFNPYGPGYIPARRSHRAYDGTAVDACEELASGLHSYMTNPAERWFGLEIEGHPEINEIPEVVFWLELVSDIIYSAYADERAAFDTSLHEGFLDIGSYGTECIYQAWDPEDRHLFFRTYPIADIFVDESSKGQVDTVYRQIRWTIRQARQEFKELPPKMNVLKEDEEMLVIHAVFPRTDRNVNGLGKLSMPFASVWVCEKTGEIIDEGGYWENPYSAARWLKLSGEIWGKGPGHKCLPDIRLLNKQEETVIKASERMTDPSLIVPDEAFLTPIRTSPGSINYSESMEVKIERLPTAERGLPITLDMMNQKRNFIQKCFHIDWLRMEKQNQEMTALEVADRREEKLRLLSPMIGRQNTELLGPCIGRSYSLLDRAGRIPPAPRILEDKSLKVGFSSPATRAQLGVKAVVMGRYIQELVALAQINPEIMDAVDFDQFANQLGHLRGVSRKILRSVEQIQQKRAQRQQQQAIQQAAAVSEPVTKSIKNLADAQAKGNLAVNPAGFTQ